MTILTPLWMQNASYPARYDRQLIRQCFGDREMVFSGLLVQQRGAGANVSVDIGIGVCTIRGDDQADQGLYLVHNDAVFNQVMPAVPGTNKRYDLISLRINDPQAGGPAGDNATFVITQGVASATPSVPATPTSAIPLATALRTAGDPAILNAHIAMVQVASLWPYTVSASGVPTVLPPNYLYARTG